MRWLLEYISEIFIKIMICRTIFCVISQMTKNEISQYFKSVYLNDVYMSSSYFEMSSLDVIWLSNLPLHVAQTIQRESLPTWTAHIGPDIQKFDLYKPGANFPTRYKDIVLVYQFEDTCPDAGWENRDHCTRFNDLNTTDYHTGTGLHTKTQYSKCGKPIGTQRLICDTYTDRTHQWIEVLHETQTNLQKIEVDILWMYITKGSGLWHWVENTVTMSDSLVRTLSSGDGCSDCKHTRLAAALEIGKHQLLGHRCGRWNDCKSSEPPPCYIHGELWAGLHENQCNPSKCNNMMLTNHST